jgi:hypothetical protein
MNAMGGPLRMSKKTKAVRKTIKKAKKAAKKARKDDDKVDTSSVQPKAPFST